MAHYSLESLESPVGGNIWRLQLIWYCIHREEIKDSPESTFRNYYDEVVLGWIEKCGKMFSLLGNWIMFS